MSVSNDSDESDFTEMTILSKGRAIEYVVPSFPVCKKILREVKLQWKDHAEDVIHVFDGFAQDCEELNLHVVPAIARIFNRFDHAFVIEVRRSCRLPCCMLWNHISACLYSCIQAL